jgi:GAF domain-containing protein
VAEVDWKETGACCTAVLRELEAMASRYAMVFRGITALRLSLDLHRLLAAPADRHACALDYDGILRLVAQMVGAQRGAIFIRHHHSGHYQLATAIGRPQWRDEEHFYRAGDGCTGWVIRWNRALRLPDVKDKKALAAIRPEPPMWRRKCYDVPDHDLNNSAWMGVPIAVGDEVIGVLRVASRVYETAFGAFDEQVALAAAARLAGHLYKQIEARRVRCLTDLALSLHTASSPEALAARLGQTLQDAVGDCHFRLWFRDAEFGRSGGRSWGADLARKVCQTGQPYVSHDLAAAPAGAVATGDDARRNSLPAQGDFACFPVLAGSERVGALCVHRPEPSTLTSGDMGLIENMAFLMGDALSARAAGNPSSGAAG